MSLRRLLSRVRGRPRRMLVSIHIPKTAGTTFNEIVRANFPRVLAISSPQEVAGFLAMPLAERSAYPAAIGHMPFGIDRYVTVPCRYVVFVREPVDHTVSSYYYVLRTPSNPQHARVSKMSLREYVESDRWPINDNLQTRWLSYFEWPEVVGPSGWARPSPCSADDLRHAKAHLDRCEFVGLYDRFEASVRRCCEVVGLRYASLGHLNRTAERPPVHDIDAETRKIIEQRRRFDAELYRYAAERFASL